MLGPTVHAGSPEHAQMLHAAQQGHMHPAYAMYGPGMMYMGPQASTVLPHLLLCIPSHFTCMHTSPFCCMQKTHLPGLGVRIKQSAM